MGLILGSLGEVDNWMLVRNVMAIGSLLINEDIMDTQLDEAVAPWVSSTLNLEGVGGCSTHGTLVRLKFLLWCPGCHIVDRTAQVLKTIASTANSHAVTRLATCCVATGARGCVGCLGRVDVFTTKWALAFKIFERQRVIVLSHGIDKWGGPVGCCHAIVCLIRS
jgi:hypothetical protein